MASIKQRIQNILQLVPFPAVAMEVIRLVDNPKTSAAKLGEVISQDQALAAKVLKVANSPSSVLSPTVKLKDIFFDACSSAVI